MIFYTDTPTHNHMWLHHVILLYYFPPSLIVFVYCMLILSYISWFIHFPPHLCIPICIFLACVSLLFLLFLSSVFVMHQALARNEFIVQWIEAIRLYLDTAKNRLINDIYQSQWMQSVLLLLLLTDYLVKTAKVTLIKKYAIDSPLFITEFDCLLPLSFIFLLLLPRVHHT